MSSCTYTTKEISLKLKRDSELNARFLLNKHGNLYFLLLNNSVHVILFDLKIFKKLSEGKKIKVKACTKPLLWDAKYDHNYTNALRPRRFKLCDIFYMILFSYTIGTFYLSSFFFPKSDYFNKLPFFVICDMRNFLTVLPC